MTSDHFVDHQLLALWAADCAEHVIAIFTAAESDDARPHDAIAAARDWVSGKLPMVDARSAAFAAHAAARDTESQLACFAARAAGHAAATAHVADHAQHAAAYAIKAAADPDTERVWQRQQLAPHLQPQLFPELRDG
ncbi:putative immunity protein [Rhodopirellula sallentina]|uniref:putative immunity protein n=1 Tax=Rhodopirellula sallentina TaxID=1263869 RepID=UPI0005C7DEDF